MHVEISSISFHYLDDLPKGCFGVYPFISKLKRWINGRGASVMKRRKGSAARSRSVSRMEAASIQASKLEKARSASVTTILKRKATKGRSGSESRKENGSLARDFDKRNELTFDGTTSKSWNVADMFAANAKLTGSEYAYDGSSQNFGSYHPRYMNYNDIEAERSKNTAAVNASMKRDMLLSVLLKGTKVSGISSNNNGAGDDSDKIATDANPNGNMCSSLGDGLQRHCAAASIIFGDLGKNNASVSRDVVIGAILGDLFEGAASLDTKAILAAWD